MDTSYMVTRINIVTTKLSNLACSTKIVQLSLFHVKILIWEIKNIISQLEMKAETRYVKSLTAREIEFVVIFRSGDFFYLRIWVLTKLHNSFAFL